MGRGRTIRRPWGTCNRFVTFCKKLIIIIKKNKKKTGQTLGREVPGDFSRPKELLWGLMFSAEVSSESLGLSSKDAHENSENKKCKYLEGKKYSWKVVYLGRGHEISFRPGPM